MAASSNSPFSSSGAIPGTNPIAGDDRRNNLKGTNGSDYLDGAGGADTLRGGRGNDTLVFDALDRLIDGGQGNDTLRVASGNQLFSLNKKQRIKSIEAIDFASTGNRLTLTAADIRRVSETDQLVITGGQGNVVDAGTGWRWTGVSNDQRFNLFIKDGILLSVDARIQMVGFNGLPPAPAAPPSTPELPATPASPSTPVPPSSSATSAPPSAPLPPINTNPGVPVSPSQPVSDPRLSLDIPSGSNVVQLGSSDDIWAGATNQPAGMTDSVFGGAGNDKLSSTTAGAELSGEAGQDTLSSTGAGSVLDGGEGDDVLIFTRHDQTLLGGSGVDRLRLSGGNQDVVLKDITRIDGVEIIEFASTPNALVLTANDIAQISDTDTLRITSYWSGNVVDAGSDWLWSGFSDDHRFNVFTRAGVTLMTEIGVQLKGMNMWNVAEAGPGNFQFSTRAGTPDGVADYVIGGNGNDTLNSSTPLALIYGNNGSDILSSTAYGAQLHGGADNDTLILNNAAQILNGGTGTDTLRLNGSNQTVSLSVHPHIRNIEEIQFASSGNNLTLSADDVGRISSNNHLVIKGPTANTIDPGSGWRVTGFNTDLTTMMLAKNSSSLLVPSTMNIVGVEKIYTSYLGPANDVWEGLVRIPAGFKEFIYGEEGNDRVTSSTPMSTIYGGAGDDHLNTSGKGSQLFGDAGNDTLEARADAVMYGGDGNDTILFNSENFLVGYGGAGADIFRVGELVTNGIDIRIADFNRLEGDKMHLDLANYLPLLHLFYLDRHGAPGGGYEYEIGYKLNDLIKYPVIRVAGVELGNNLTFAGVYDFIVIE